MIIDLSGATLQRRIVAPSQTFENYLTIEESHLDEAIITEHPVEMGAVMSDHIYLRPPELTLRLGWSNSDVAATGPAYVQDIYAKLLTLKNSRKLFQVYTGKRFYKNMFVTRIPVRTDETHEYALVAEAHLKQVLLVSTQVISGKGNSATNSNVNTAPGAQANPERTQPTSSVGSTQTTSTNGIPEPLSNTRSSLRPGQTNTNDGGVGGSEPPT